MFFCITVFRTEDSLTFIITDLNTTRSLNDVYEMIKLIGDGTVHLIKTMSPVQMLSTIPEAGSWRYPQQKSLLSREI